MVVFLLPFEQLLKMNIVKWWKGSFCMKNLAKNEHKRVNIGRKCGIIGICCNAILFLGKLIVGIIVSVFIVVNGTNLLKQAISRLLGEGATEELERHTSAFMYK